MADRIEPVDPPKDAPKAERPKRRAAPNTVKLKEQLAELYVTLGLVVVTPIDRLGGALLAANADDLAEQWIALAETNPAVKRTLQKLVEVGGWGGVIMAHGMIVLPVLANRGMFPDQVAGGAAAMTMMQHPEVAPLFTHPRFNTERQPEGNGNGATGS